MITIATLGAVIDPTGATVGAAAVVAAAGTVVAAFRGVRAAQQALAQGRGGFQAMAIAATTTSQSIARGFQAAFRAVTGSVQMMARTVIGSFNAIKNSIVSVSQGLATFGLAVNGLRTVFAPFTAAARTAFGFLQESITKSANLESTELAIRGLLGSAGKARDMMAELQKVALNTTLEFPDTADAARQLLSYGIAAEKVIPAIKRLADINALTGGKSSMQDLAYLYGTANAQSHLYTRDIMQFGTRGIDVLSALSLTLKKSKDEVSKMVEEGKVGFKDLERALESMTAKGGIAFGQQSLQMESWNGRLAKLTESWDLLQAAIGKPVMDGLKPLLDDLSGLVSDLTVQIQAMYPAIRQIVDYIPAAFRVMREEGGLKLAFQAAADWLVNKLTQFWEFTKSFLGATFQWIGNNFTAAMKFLASEEFWAGVGRALVKGVKEALNVLKAGAEAMDTLVDQATGADLERRAARLEAQGKRFNEAANRLNTPGAYDNYVRPEGMRARDEAVTRQYIEVELPQLEKAGGPSTPLLPMAPSWAQMDFDAAEAWEDAAQEATPSMLEFGKQVWNQLLTLAQERQATEAANMLTGAEQESAADKRNAELAAIAAAGGGSPDKAAARKAASQDNALNRLAQRYLEAADPEAELNRRLGDIQKLYDANKISIEQRKMLEADAQEKYRLDLQKSVDETRKAAAAMATPLQKLAAEWGNIQKNAQMAAVGIAEAFAGHITGALTDMITGTKSVAQAFSDMAQGIIRDILQIITKLLVQYAISQAINSLGGGGGGFLGFASGALGKIFHEGGDVSGPAPVRAMTSGQLASARRYHSGGVAGLNPGEVPAILERGEHVLTRRKASEQKRKLTAAENSKSEKKTGGGVIVNLFDPRQIAAVLSEHPEAILNVMEMKKTTVKRILS